MKTQLLENIKAINTGQREYIDSPLTSIRTTYEPIDLAAFTPEMGYIYRIDVRLGISQVISELELQKNPDIVNQYKTYIERGIAEEVYGEVRKELIGTVIELRQTGMRYNHPSIERLEKLIEKITY